MGGGGGARHHGCCWAGGKRAAVSWARWGGRDEEGRLAHVKGKIIFPILILDREEI
jgi:hypothetical protein